jgi:hypothetical protein
LTLGTSGGPIPGGRRCDWSLSAPGRVVLEAANRPRSPRPTGDVRWLAVTWLAFPILHGRDSDVELSLSGSAGRGLPAERSTKGIPLHPTGIREGDRVRVGTVHGQVACPGSRRFRWYS